MYKTDYPTEAIHDCRAAGGQKTNFISSSLPHTEIFPALNSPLHLRSTTQVSTLLAHHQVQKLQKYKFSTAPVGITSLICLGKH